MSSPKWTRVSPGHYKTTDGNFEVKRVKSQQTGRRTEIVWEITIYGYGKGTTLPMCHERLKDAKYVVERYY